MHHVTHYFPYLLLYHIFFFFSNKMRDLLLS
jgi:hypothetical protein